MQCTGMERRRGCQAHVCSINHTNTSTVKLFFDSRQTDLLQISAAHNLILVFILRPTVRSHLRLQGLVTLQPPCRAVHRHRARNFNATHHFSTRSTKKRLTRTKTWFSRARIVRRGGWILSAPLSVYPTWKKKHSLTFFFFCSFSGILRGTGFRYANKDEWRMRTLRSSLWCSVQIPATKTSTC